jgi:ATP-dependent RNA helicase DbpA
VPRKFDSLDLSPALLTVVAELGYEELTPIQAQSIPVMLEGRDLVGQSETGSGKTAAFGLPILQRLQLAPRTLQAIVLCPTRELSAQVATEFRRLGRRHPGLRILEVLGGQPFWPQANSLERRVHVVVGTPGRVLDHLRRGTLDLRRVKIVVLDEADRMLDMGFEEDIGEILRATPTERQTALFSATFPPAFEALSAGHQRDAVRVTVETEEAAPETLRQRVVMVEPEAKLDALQWALAEHEHEMALVFCNMKTTVREVVAALDANGVAADCLHGDLEQFDRDCVMAMFRNRSVRVLVATDVAARGIDVTDLALVVNYDLPGRPEVYVHRVGRTGRAGREGASVTFVTPHEQRRLAVIEELAGRSIERAEWAPLMDLAVIQRPVAMHTIRVGGGRKDKIRPGDILGALTGDAAGLQGADVGKIEVLPHMTYVAVTADLAERAARKLDAGRIKGRFFRARLVRRGES